MTDQESENNQVIGFKRFSTIDVREQDPFFEDLLNRKQEIESLTELVIKAQTPFVLCVEGVWGNGKTSFLKMWKAYLENIYPSNFKIVSKPVCINFNAWQVDFMNNSLTPLIFEIKKELVESNLFCAEDLCDLKGIIKDLAYTVTTMLGYKHVTDVISERTGPDVIYNKYLNYNTLISEFNKKLSSIANKNKKISGLPLIIFIDELDRCRPVFALDVLEKIKHIFEVENVFIVIAANLSQLEETVLSVNGNINSKLYLKKFFNQIYPLINKKGVWTKALSEPDLDHKFIEKYTNIIPLFQTFIDNAIPRQQEAIIADYLTIYNKYYKNQSRAIDLALVFLVFLLCLKEKENQIYCNIFELYNDSSNSIILFSKYYIPLPIKELLNFFCSRTTLPNPISLIDSNTVDNRSLEKIPSFLKDLYFILLGIYNFKFISTESQISVFDSFLSNHHLNYSIHKETNSIIKFSSMILETVCKIEKVYVPNTKFHSNIYED